MTFTPHNTEEEKAMRRIKYWLLRTCRKDLSVKACNLIRDWTNNKCLMVIQRRATPIR